MADGISKTSPHGLRHERRRIFRLRSAIRDDPPIQPERRPLPLERSPGPLKRRPVLPERRQVLPDLERRPVPSPPPETRTVLIAYVPPKPPPPLRSPIKRAPRKPLSDEQRMDIQRQPTNQQTESPFFKILPAEIRLQIYEALLSHGKVHIDWPYVPPVYSTKASDSGWFHGICCNDNSQDPFWKDSCLASNWSYSNAEKGLPKADRLDTGMLYTCRLVYSEMISILYSTNTFHLSYTPTLYLFQNAILPERLAVIKSLDFAYRLQTYEHPTVSKTAKTDYDNLWSILYSFSGLRSLRVAIRTVDRPMAPPSEQDLRHIRESWLSPLEQFKNLEAFDLAVPQRLKECLEPAFSNSPHRLLTLEEQVYSKGEGDTSLYRPYGHQTRQFWHLKSPLSPWRRNC